MKQVLLCLFCLLSAIGIHADAQEDRKISVFAASSLTDAFTDLAETFEARTEFEIVLNFASSSTLAAQLNEGAEADIFASANLAQMENLAESGLIDTLAIVPFAENELVIIVPVDNPAQISSAEDLANPNLLLVLAAPAVPIRDYSDELLENLVPFYGENFPVAVLENLVSEEANVRQVVARVALGEADAGIVYRSDITPDVAESLMLIPVPEGTSPRATYPIAPLIAAPNPEGAQAFIDYILSEEGQAILQSWGFCAPHREEIELEVTSEVTPEIEMTVEADAQTSC